MFVYCCCLFRRSFCYYSERLQEPRRRRLSCLPLYLIPATPSVLSRGTTAAFAFGVADYCLVRRASLLKQVFFQLLVEKAIYSNVIRDAASLVRQTTHSNKSNAIVNRLNSGISLKWEHS